MIVGAKFEDFPKTRTAGFAKDDLSRLFQRLTWSLYIFL